MSGIPSGPTGGADDFSRRLSEQMEQADEQAGTSPAEQPGSTEQEQAAPQDDAATSEPVGQGDYVVRRGDCIASIARKTGHFWNTIWSDSANSELREVRGDPNILMRGDRVTIPELRQKDEPCETETLHRFQRRGEPGAIHIRLRDQNDQPIAGKEYHMYIDQQTFDGTTEADGSVRANIPSTARNGFINVPELNLIWPLKLGHLDPIETVEGVQARLNNMGYPCGSVDGRIREATRAAIKAFQADNELTPDGALTEETRQKIKDEHGS